MYYFFVVDSESSQLPTVNAYLKGNFEQNTQFLANASWVHEVSIAKAAAARRGQPLHFDELAQDAIKINKQQSMENVLDRFWGMGLMGLVPLSAVLNGFTKSDCLTRLRTRTSGI